VNRTLSQRLYSLGGLVLIAVLLLTVLAVSESTLRGKRLDLTENNLYTLSAGLESILQGLDEPIHLRLFYSQAQAQDFPSIRNHARRVRELLREMEAVAGDKLKVSIIEPEPFSDAEDTAVELGIQAIPISNAGDNLYFGLAGTNAVGQEEAIPILDPQRAAFLEYDIAKLVYPLDRVDKPVVGLLSTLEVGGGVNRQTMQRQEPWVMVEQLRQLFEVRELSPEDTRIPSELEALILIRPSTLEDTALRAIDRFAAEGGRVLAFVDPYAERGQPQQSPVSEPLQRLLEHWGVRWQPDQFLADATQALQVNVARSQPPVYHYGMLGLEGEALNGDDVVTRGLQQINLAYAGILEPVDNATTQVTPLLQSSDQAMPMGRFRLSPGLDPASLQSDFEATGQRYTVAARVRGPVTPLLADNGTAAEAAQTAEAEDASASGDGDAVFNAILVADTDLLTDRLWVDVQNILGQRLTTAWAANGDLVTNAVDNLLGSDDLISIRTRADYSRPFTRVEALEREADRRFRQKEEELQARLEETERQLQELQRQRQDGNALMMTAEQRETLERFQQRRLEIREELREVRHQLDRDIERLGAQVKFINIILMPLLVLIVALFFAGLRRRRVARLVT